MKKILVVGSHNMDITLRLNRVPDAVTREGAQQSVPTKEEVM